MSTINKIVYNLQRFQILQTKLNSSTMNLIPDSYAYAWYRDLFPHDDDSDLHFDLEECFSVNKSMINTVMDFADAEFSLNRTYTFYEYERKFVTTNNNGLHRSGLISIFRYYYLKNTFDDNFWNKLLEKMKYPIEVESICKPFNINELNLI